MNSLLISGLLVFVFLLFNGVFLGIIFAMRRKSSEAGRWPSTNGAVTASTTEWRSSGEGSAEYPVIRYSYQVGGQAFQGDRIAPGPQMGGSGAARVTERYPVGAPVHVFYNPQNPAEAVLEKKAPAQTLMWVILGIINCAMCMTFPMAWLAISNR